MAAVKKDTSQCSKPGCDRPRSSEESTNPWCREHWAEYVRGYKKGQIDRAESAAFQLGVRAFQGAIVVHMRHFNQAMFSGTEVAEIIRTMDTVGLNQAYSTSRKSLVET